MAIAEELQILVNAKVTQAVNDMKKVDKSIDSTSKTTSKLKDAFKAMAGPVALGAVIVGMVKLGKEAEKAFQVQEKAELGLLAALKATGQYTAEAYEEMKTFASELQNVTTVGDETSIRLQQTALNMGLTAEQAKEATKQAIGMSEAYGVGLETSLRAASNAALGNFDALTRYLPAIKNATTEAEKSAIVQKQLGDAFEIAKSNALSAAGVQQQLENSYGDLQETIGGVISEAMTPFRSALKDEVESVNKTITAHILRKKAINGEATLIEELTLKQLEYEKTEQTLADAKRSLALETASLNKNLSIQDDLAQMNAQNAIANVRQIQNEVTALEDSLTLKKLGIKAAEDAVRAENDRIEANIRFAQGLDSVTDSTDDNTTAIEENLTAEQLAADERLRMSIMVAEAIEDRDRRIQASSDESKEALISDLEETEIAWLSFAASVAGAMAGLFGGINQLQQQNTENVIAELDKQQEAALEAAGLAEATTQEKLDNQLQAAIAEGDAEKIAAAKLAADRNVIIEKFERKKAEAEYKGALASWGLTLAQATATGAQVIINGFASQPFVPVGIAMGALATVATGIQLGAIAASKPTLAFAEGGSFLTSGSQQITVGDNAGGIERVTVEPVSSAGANEGFGGGGGNVVLVVDGKQFTAHFQKQIDNRALRSSMGGAI